MRDQFRGHSQVTVEQTDAGKTFNVHGGDFVRVVLDDNSPVPGSSLGWNVASSPTTVLQPGTVSRTPQVKNGPRRTDTYTAEFRAITRRAGGAGRQGRHLLRSDGQSQTARISTSRSL
jgi:hypothetical protein